jgi:translation initiation factor IF-3
VRIEDAIRLAQEADLDLVEVAPNSKPPVAKIMDFGKFKYETAQKAKEARRNQANTILKEVRFRLKIDVHDYETKRKRAEGFLQAGDKVKAMILFRGREQSRPEQGVRLLQRFAEDVAEFGSVESTPTIDGRNMVMVIGPLKNKSDAKAEADAKKAASKPARSERPDDEDATGSADAQPETSDAPVPAVAKAEQPKAEEPKAERDVPVATFIRRPAGSREPAPAPVRSGTPITSSATRGPRSSSPRPVGAGAPPSSAPRSSAPSSAPRSSPSSAPSGAPTRVPPTSSGTQAPVTRTPVSTSPAAQSTAAQATGQSRTPEARPATTATPGSAVPKPGIPKPGAGMPKPSAMPRAPRPIPSDPAPAKPDAQ